MSIVSEYIRPFFEWYHRALEGEYIASELQYKGGKEAGFDYSAKIERAQRRAIRDRYYDSKAATILLYKH